MIFFATQSWPGCDTERATSTYRHQTETCRRALVGSDETAVTAYTDSQATTASPENQEVR